MNEEIANLSSEKRRQIIITGVIGIIASLLMFSGDMFLYFTTEPISSLEKELTTVMKTISSQRLMMGGLLGPIAAIFYTIGFVQIYLLIQDNYKTLGKINFGLFASTMIIGGAYHALFAPLGFIASIEHAQLLNTMFNFLEFMGIVTFIFLGIANIMFGILILQKKTILPRWVVLFLPILTTWLSFALEQLPSPFMIIFLGGWGNLVFLIFFIVTTVSILKFEQNNKI